MARTLFLLGGGSEILDAVNQAFIDAAGPDPVLALLLQGGPGWESYLPQYIRPWQRRGVRHYHILVPDANGVLNTEAAIAVLRTATGIFIGGGNTEIYRRLYATEPIRTVIRERYQQGVPVAGLSAGAILASDVALLLPEEAGSSSVQVAQGLGLLPHCIIGVHFTEFHALADMLVAMRKSHVQFGLGIDENACAVLEDERLCRVIGHSVYTVQITDFDTSRYVVEEVSVP
ncbi:MAG: type 1 glutamine amidotransferase-like domain-containing protein [Chloroflexi bacterium]|nr:type 1 glutamine amidotransferase-like domain-containing protein [Chloroflexota bacterium]